MRHDRTSLRGRRTFGGRSNLSWFDRLLRTAHAYLRGTGLLDKIRGWARFARNDAIYLALVLTLPAVASAARVEIRNGQFYVDGEPFYVRAIGYSSLRPHQRPDVSYASVNHNWMAHDFERIKAAHFNTIRTFDAFSPEELELAQHYGLMVLQGIWMDRRQDFSNQHNVDAALATVQRVAEQSKPYDNVLGYLLMSKPQPKAVLDSGVPDTLQFFRRLKRSLQTIDPRPVSLDSWLPIAFLDHSDSDFVTFSAFDFWPRAINDAMTYPGYVRWLVDQYAPDRPFLVGATGGYAVSKATSSADGGVGGLTEYNQSLRDLTALRGTLQGHANGAVLVSWIDSWQAAGDPDTHDDDPWEWNGLLGIATDNRADTEGVARRVLRDVTAHNEVLIVEPRADHYYPVLTSVPVSLTTAEGIVGARFSINGGDYIPLQGSGHGWFHGFFRLPKLARHRQRITVQALDSDGTIIMEKSLSFLAALSPESVEIEAVKERADGLTFVVRALDGQRKPLAQRKVTYGFFLPVTLRDVGGTATTNAQGEATIHCTLQPETPDRYLYVAAGTRNPDRVTASTMGIFKLGR